jgi:A/G-specific adenine glycosylase
MNAADFATRLLAWHAHAGRHDLPWQRDRTAYRVWVSEIMLQQTQVTTVIPYFERFMARFPDAKSLADASADEVLHLWAGLGYYARARNLHQAACIIRDRHAGIFPRTLEEVMALPGIGRSTAGAILSLACGQRHPILDGNVKRVLTRHRCVDGAIDDVATLASLWRLADVLTPPGDVATYTQAIMDLGATVCTRSKPRCTECPVADDCGARREGRQSEFPAPKRRRAPRPRRRSVMLVARHASLVLLFQRPEQGIWGGLWCLPEFGDREAAIAFAQRELTSVQQISSALADIEHRFTHFDLVITPILANCEGDSRIRDARAMWYDLGEPARVGLPAPIRTLLQRLPRLTERHDP